MAEIFYCFLLHFLFDFILLLSWRIFFFLQIYCQQIGKSFTEDLERMIGLIEFFRYKVSCIFYPALQSILFSIGYELIQALILGSSSLYTLKFFIKFHHYVFGFPIFFGHSQTGFSIRKKILSNCSGLLDRSELRTETVAVRSYFFNRFSIVSANIFLISLGIYCLRKDSAMCDLYR